MRRLAVTTIVPLALILALTLPAQARVTWCRSDPIVQLDGVPVAILVDIPQQYLHLVNGAVRVKVRTPKNVQRDTVFTDGGFNGYGESVEFTDLSAEPNQDKRFPSTIEVSIPVEQSPAINQTNVPVQVTVIPADTRPRGVRGTSYLATVGFSVSQSWAPAAGTAVSTSPDQVPLGGDGDSSSDSVGTSSGS